MTPKEKAEELVIKMYNVDSIDYFDELSMQYKHAIRCALIAVDEILEDAATEYQIQYDNGEYSREIGFRYPDFWIEVKKELEKI